MKSRTNLLLGDYVAEGLQVIVPDHCFPNMGIGDKANHPWPYVRRHIKHNWYCDRRFPEVGFLNRDEAVLLYNLALPFKGKPALEIGCWMGWSTCHLALAGLALDAVDPVLGVSEHAASVRQSLTAAGVLHSVRLYAASSPEGVKQIAELTGTRWNFFFVDGDHEAPAPEKDAEVCLRHAADDAIIVFHDLVSPDVERGLDVFRREGWQTLIYQTMQIMGVAWRGYVRPVVHIPDPSISWSLPPHLAKYRVSPVECEVSLSTQSLAMSEAERWKSENSRLQTDLAAREGTISKLQTDLAAREGTINKLQTDLAAREGTISRLQTDLAAREDTISKLQTDLAAREGTIRAVLQSRSWRITAPLRTSKRVALQLIAVPHRAVALTAKKVSRMLETPPSAPKLKVLVGLLPERLRRFLLEVRRKRAILRSGLFDAEYYLAQNPEVAEVGMDPLRHYLKFGAARGCDPSPFFDTSYYLETNRDVAQAGVNPLAHYVTRGAKEGRRPHPQTAVPPGRSQSAPESSRSSSEGAAGDGFDVVSAPVRPPDGGVCIVTPDIVGPVKNGGIGTACYHFARTLVDAGHVVSILFTGDVTDSEKAHWRRVYKGMQINFIALSDTPPEKRPVWGSNWFLERSWRVFQFLRESKLSIIHFQDWQGMGFWSIKAKQVGLAFSQTVLTVMTHSCTKWINQGMQQFSADPFETAKLIWAETYAIEHCDVLLSPSQYMFNWAAENQIRCPSRIVRTPYAYVGDEPASAEVASPVDNDHFIFFGRLETRKGLHILGEALRQLKHDRPSALPRQVSFLGKHASVIGRPSADYLKELKQEFKALEFRAIDNLDHADALRYIRESRGLVVIPSLVDNYPLTVVECVQNRIPFLAAATGGIPEMVDEQISFEPTPGAFSRLLINRHAIDHSRLEHKYSANIAKKTWCDLHTELFAIVEKVRSSSAHSRRPLGDTKVSVCIPLFNHHRHVEPLIAAFSKQRYSNFEVILVDDGSPQESAQEFKRIAAENRDGRFRFLRIDDNRGPGLARNFAVTQAGGELLVFFDADNLPKSDFFIATLVRALQESKADCVTCPYDVVDAGRGLPREEDIISTYRPIGPCLEAGFFENTLGDTTMIIKRAVFEKLGGFSANRSSWEDHELLLRLCFRGFKLESVPDALFYYRQSAGGRNAQANLYKNYESLFRQLQDAPAADLARIVESVAGPLLLQRNGAAMRVVAP